MLLSGRQDMFPKHPCWRRDTQCGMKHEKTPGYCQIGYSQNLTIMCVWVTDWEKKKKKVFDIMKILISWLYPRQWDV